jgi:thiol-disulfide isomerase/thioredoxin
MWLAVLLTLWRPGVEPSVTGWWKAGLDLAGGQLRFAIAIEKRSSGLAGRLCNGPSCLVLSRVELRGDSVVFEMEDYAATISAVMRGDSLVGIYHNVGSRGPRVIPFRAARGRWPAGRAADALLGNWDATFIQDWQTSPRVFVLRNGKAGLEGTVISNSGDYGLFWGQVTADSFALSHFDGSFVYLLTGRLTGDTLRGTFHAGLRTQTPWIAVRSTGAPHLTPPSQVIGADTIAPFRFSFPDLNGVTLNQTDPRFAAKVLLVDIFGTWCPTCHDAAPTLVQLYRDYHARGLEIVGLAYEVSGDPAANGVLVRRYQEKFGIPFPLLLAGTNDAEAAAASQPQLKGVIAFPTTVFVGRDGRVRLVHAGFYGPATGAQHERLVREFREEIERLLQEK